MPKVLIFGGTGYLGSAISENLSLKNSYDLTVNYKNSKKVSRFFINKVNQNVQTVNIDVLNFNDVKKLLEDTNPDIVVDLTGLLNVSKAQQIQKKVLNQVH